MLIAPVLQRFVDDELALAPSLIERTLGGAVRLLREGSESPLNPSERAHQGATAQALKAHGAGYQSAFIESLRARVKDVLAEQHGGAPPGARIAALGLELVDEARIEIDIEISRAMQLIDTTAEWELRELQTFTSTLVGQSQVSAESNPFRPSIYASSLWDAACAASAVPVQRTLILRLSAGVIAGLLKSAWAAACSRLEALGVEPSVYRTVLLAPGTVAGRRPARVEPGKTATMASLLASMPTGSAELRMGVGQSGFEMGTPVPPRSAANPSSAEFEEALARLDEVLRHLPAPEAQTRESSVALAKRLNPHRAALIASAGAAIERQTVELLSRVFDCIVADPQVPPGFIAVLARLQASALRVALSDPGMVTSSQHPVWRFLDRVAQAGIGYPQASDPRATEILEFCTDQASQLARAAEPDATMYERAITRLDALLSEQLQQQLRAAETAVRTLQLAERRELLEQRLRQRLVDQLAPAKTSASIRRFVTLTWAKVLAESMQRHGEQSEVTRGYIKLVDELQWSLELPDHPLSRQRLLTLLPGMLQRLRSGMDMAGMPAAEQEGVLDELMTIHTAALRPGRGQPLEPSAEQLVQRMRDEVLPASTGHGAFGDSVIDVASMQTVPAELMQSAAHADEPARRIEALREAERLRLFLQGRWARVQLLWRSELKMYFLFAGETPGRTHSITLRALERLNLAGLVQPQEAQTLVQRALDTVARELTRPG